VLKKKTLITFYSDVRWPFLFGVGCVTALDGCASRLALRIFRQASRENQEPKIIVLIFSFLLEFVGRFGAQEMIGSSLTSWSNTQAYCSPHFWLPPAMACPVDQGSEEEGGGSVDQATREAPSALKTAAVA